MFTQLLLRAAILTLAQQVHLALKSIALMF